MWPTTRLFESSTAVGPELSLSGSVLEMSNHSFDLFNNINVVEVNIVSQRAKLLRISGVGSLLGGICFLAMAITALVGIIELCDENSLHTESDVDTCNGYYGYIALYLPLAGE